ncbi:MAG: hypothetical protein ACKVQJ_06065 [Pyrinomonadaceae bacterium]
MKRGLAITTGLMLLLSAAAFGQLRLVPMKYSKVKLVNGKRSVTVDLDDALARTNGTMPGEAPHKYKVLFRTQKGGFLYLVANVQSRSPISDPNAPCGGDSPQSILWIKADRNLKHREFQSEIYESCSYNLYDSKVNITRSSVTINYGKSTRKQVYYRNREPQKGLVLGEFSAMPQIN